MGSPSPSRPQDVPPTLDLVYAPWAAELAEQLLAEALPDRWAHSHGVGLYARELGWLAGEHADALEAAAFLHDIGYAPTVRETGFHPLDSARYLRDRTDASPLICMLVANHTGALIEGRHRGLSGVIESEFPIGASPNREPTALITHCDLSVGPTGSRISAVTRLREIANRYAPDHPVNRSINESKPLLLECDRKVRSWIESEDPKRTSPPPAHPPG